MMSTSNNAQGKSRRKQKGQASKKRVPAKKESSVGLVQYPLTKIGTKKLSPYYRRVVQQMTSPGSVGQNLVVSPNRGAHLVCVRHIHKMVDVDQLAYPQGFTVLMNPDLTSPSYISGPLAALYPTVVGPVGARGVATVDASGKWTSSGMTVAASSETTNEKLKFEKQTIGGIDYYGFKGTFIGNGKVGVLNKSLTDKVSPSVLIWTWDGVAPAPTLVGSTQPLVEGASEALTVPFPPGAIWLLFTPANAGGKVLTLQFELGLERAQFDLAPYSNFTSAFPPFILDDGVTSGRVLSMSILATNTTPMLQKGGNINAGRVPTDFDAFDNIAGNMASLPESRRYQSTAETGAYVFWIPQDLDEYEINDVQSKRESYRAADYLLVNVQWPAGAGTAGSFKLHFDWMVEFYTPNQLFEKVLPPPVTTEMENILFVLNQVGAATCNPEHGEKFREVLDSLVSKGKAAIDLVNTGVDHIEKYGPYYVAAAEALASLLG